jgi:hypothetical protein
VDAAPEVDAASEFDTSTTSLSVSSLALSAPGRPQAAMISVSRTRTLAAALTFPVIRIDMGEQRKRIVSSAPQMPSLWRGLR